jgi:hypothetical protein
VAEIRLEASDKNGPTLLWQQHGADPRVVFVVVREVRFYASADENSVVVV